MDAEAQKDADEFGFDAKGNFYPLKGMSEVVVASCLSCLSCLSCFSCLHVLHVLYGCACICKLAGRTVFVCLSVCVCVCLCVSLLLSLCVYVYVHMHVHIHAFCACVHTYMHACTTCIHAHKHPPPTHMNTPYAHTGAVRRAPDAVNAALISAMPQHGTRRRQGLGLKV